MDYYQDNPPWRDGRPPGRNGLSLPKPPPPTPFDQTGEGCTWRRFLGALMIIHGLTAGAYLEWCLHRLHPPVAELQTWPRPWPYPDRWLERWNKRIEAAYPVAPGYMVCWGFDRLLGRLRAYSVWAVAVFTAGVALVFWPPTGRQFSQGASVGRGVALGLVIGVSWVALIGFLADGPSSVWFWLAVFAPGLAIAGAAFGVTPRHRKLVGLAASFMTLCLLGGVLKPRFLPNSPPGAFDQTGEFLGILIGVEQNLGWLVFFGGSGLLLGLALGGIHRLCERR